MWVCSLPFKKNCEKEKIKLWYSQRVNFLVIVRDLNQLQLLLTLSKISAWLCCHYFRVFYNTASIIELICQFLSSFGKLAIFSGFPLSNIDDRTTCAYIGTGWFDIIPQVTHALSFFQENIRQTSYDNLSSKGSPERCDVVVLFSIIYILSRSNLSCWSLRCFLSNYCYGGNWPFIPLITAGPHHFSSEEWSEYFLTKLHHDIGLLQRRRRVRFQEIGNVYLRNFWKVPGYMFLLLI